MKKDTYTVYSNGVCQFIFIEGIVDNQMVSPNKITPRAMEVNKIKEVGEIDTLSRRAAHSNGSLAYVAGHGDSADLSGVSLKKGKTYGKFQVC